MQSPAAGFREVRNPKGTSLFFGLWKGLLHMTKFKILLLGAVAAAGLASSANAATFLNLTVNTGWQYGQLAQVTTVNPTTHKSTTSIVLQDSSAVTVSAIKFTIVGNPENFSLTDGYLKGDKYAVTFKSGPATISSSTVFGPNPYQPDQFVNNFGPFKTPFANDWSQSGFGHLQVTLGAGTWTATVKDLTPHGYPAGFGFRLDTVPEPASWALMLVGVGGLGGMIRSRRKAVAA